MGNRWYLALGVAVAAASGCAEEPGSVPEVPAEEVTAEVQELEAVHEFMHPLWHDAVPARDLDAIQELVPPMEEALTELNQVQLPGILQDKQEAWDQGKANLMEAFQGMKAATEAGDTDAALGYAETFHMSYEGLARLIRPPLPELEAFHQHMYAAYHHYGPGYDLEKLQVAVDGMVEALGPLEEATLPASVAEQAQAFQERVARLEEEVVALDGLLTDPSREEVQEAVEAVHTAYSNVAALFE